MAQSNQGPEQQARDRIDDQLREAGWLIQDRQNLDPNAGIGVAVREYPTDTAKSESLRGAHLDRLTCCGFWSGKRSRG